MSLSVYSTPLIPLEFQGQAFIAQKAIDSVSRSIAMNDSPQRQDHL